MRHSQAKGRRSNSPANPLPIAFYGPEFRCEPAHQIVTKLMTCLRFSMPRGRFSSAETVFSPAGREMRDGGFRRNDRERNAIVSDIGARVTRRFSRAL